MKVYREYQAAHDSNRLEQRIHNAQLNFAEHKESSITGWPLIGRYCGLVIDENVATEDDWKLYLPMVGAQVGEMRPINDFGRVVKF